MSTDLPIQPILSGDPLGAVSRLAVNSAGKFSSAQAAVKAAKDFESVLLNKVLEEMKRTIPESGLLDSDTGQQVQDLFWYYLAQDVGTKGGIGLWKQVYAEFQRAGLTAPAGGAPAAENGP